MRIRSIKPEWLDDERLACASAEARVMSIALILLADDHGRGRASLLMLAGRVFPASANPREDASRAREELCNARFLVVYTVDGQEYYEIRNWAKHQRVDRPSKSQLPECPPEMVHFPAQNEPPANVREDASRAREYSRGCADHSSTDLDLDLDLDQEEIRESAPAAPVASPAGSKAKKQRTPEAKRAALEAAEAEADVLAEGLPPQLLARVRQGLAEASDSGKLSAVAWRNALRDVRAAAERHGAHAARAVADSLEVYADRYAGQRGAPYLVGIVRGWDAAAASARPARGQWRREPEEGEVFSW